GCGWVRGVTRAGSQFRGGAERRHSIPTDQSRDRRVIATGLLGELPLGHLLGLGLTSQPFVERSAILARHWGMRAPLERCGPLPRCPNYPGGAEPVSITRSSCPLGPPAPRSAGDGCGPLPSGLCSLLFCGRSSFSPRLPGDRV